MSEDICVIGAGVSGIAAARALQRAHLPFVCYEAGSKPGGLWRFGNDNGMSRIYKALHTNTSRGRTGFSDYPMPVWFPDFPHHSQVYEYLEDYLDQFELTDAIRTRHRVVKVAPSEAGGYAVTVERPDGTPQIERFKSIIVCNGHHWDPYRPELPGSFDGELIHSSEYEIPADYDQKRVLIVGAGNSACDISCDLARTANVTVSTRSGAHVIPKYLLGKPLDLWTTEVTSRLPISIQRLLFSMLVFLARGSQSRYRFPKPETKFLTSHPTISSELLNLVGHGLIESRPGIELLDGNHVRFTDGSVDQFDTIILATGYSVTFPFFEPDFVSAESNDLPLFGEVVHPTHDQLFFVGLVQPLGALAPLAEAQADWIAALLSGTAKLPSREEMWNTIKRDKEIRNRLFTKSRRHTMEVEFFGYLRRLRAATVSR
jgi:dimethylaniline monooxygenase (N-oxide forming)